MDTLSIVVIIAGLTLGLSVLIRRRRKHAKLNSSSQNPGEEITPVLSGESTFSASKIPRGTITVEVSNIQKSFGANKVVNDVSFQVKAGEIFGMVGPNGAGKTTTIRMLMDIILPDSGEVKVLGQSLQESTKDLIGYLPEERGLYKKITVVQSLHYLSSLKSLDANVSRTRADELLNRVGMFGHRNKKIEQLSRGMGQLIQFVTTILHNPELIILDEPFSGLDPVNKEILKGLILELREKGKTIILSTHQMNEVEELCDRILMINKGRAMLYGTLAEIRSRFRNNSIFLEYEGSIDQIPGVTGEKTHGKYTELFLDGKTSSEEILRHLLSRQVKINRFEVSTPSLNEIFIQVVKGE